MNDKLPANYTAADLAALDWSDIVTLLWEDVQDQDEALPDNVMQATELLLNGMPKYKVAKEIGVSTRTIKNWLDRYPMMRLAIRNGRELITKWRLSKIEEQFLKAVEVSNYILTAHEVDQDGNPKEVNSKLLGVQAQQARYILDLFFKSNVQNLILNVNVSAEEEGVFKAKDDALDYLARQLGNVSKVETVDAEFTEKHEYGHLGVLSIIDGEPQCHICGVITKEFVEHVLDEHDLEADQYEIKFRLEYGTLNKWQKEN